MRSPADLSLRRLIGERLRTLERRARRIIECAALLGYRFDVPVLMACSGNDADQTIWALTRACELDVLVADPRAPARYRFRHALSRAAIRDSLGSRAERDLHVRIALALEGLPDAALRVEELAHHWSSAGDGAKARFYNARAAEEALRLGADAAASEFSARALDTPSA